MRTRCERCGIGYLGRQVGEVCGDRSGPRRLRMRAEAAGREYIGPDACRGTLVRPGWEWKFFAKRGNRCRM